MSKLSSIKHHDAIHKAVENNDLKALKVLISDDTPIPIDAVELCGQMGFVDCLQILIKSNTPLSRNRALYNASQNGHTQCVALLIPVTNPQEHNSYALTLAAQYGRAACVELLAPISNTEECNAIWVAASEGHVECVELLIASSSLEKRNNALCSAARNGNLKCVELLIPVADPKLHSSLALQHALFNEQYACADVLISVSDIEAALKSLNTEHFNVSHRWADFESRFRKTVLKASIDTSTGLENVRKKI